MIEYFGVLGEEPILLGYSGGPDSTALLHLLLPYRDRLHLAHVDHGWRPESGEEAEQLRKQAESLSLPFHSIRLNNNELSESAARANRLDYFQELYRHLGAQALLLGHQADDQAELVLKRLLEGASLFALKGMQPVSTYEGMQVIRPLLSHTKREILQWLERRQIPYFSDATNRDTRFLRARMREETLPLLERSFGKGVARNLTFLGDEAEEIARYFSALNQPMLQRALSQGKIERSALSSLPPLQVRYFLREWIRAKGVQLSREQLSQATSAIISLQSRQVTSSSGALRIENEILLNKTTQ
jgi:tRNA(Ile)-lysidine synthase